MLNNIISSIPADPTRDEVSKVVGYAINYTSDYVELLGELLSYGMTCEFEDRLMSLLVDGVRLVNDDCEEDMFGW